MKKDDIVYMIDKKTLKIIRMITKKEYFSEFSQKQRTIISGIIYSFGKDKYDSHYGKTYKGYFYCLEKDYDRLKVKKFLFKKTYYNFIPTKKSNTVLLYFGEMLVGKFKSERKCAEYLNIKYQTLNWYFRRDGFYKKDGFKALKEDNMKVKTGSIYVVEENSVDLEDVKVKENVIYTSNSVDIEKSKENEVTVKKIDVFEGV